MKALVTGSAGFIGAHVVRALLTRGCEVRAFHLPGENLKNLQELDVELFPGDVTDSARVREAMHGCPWVFHLAALYTLWHPTPQRILDVNVGGTRNVLEAARALGTDRVVFTSSIAVFGGQGPNIDATEKSPFCLGKFGDTYTNSKAHAHALAENFARAGLNVVLVAPCVPIGPGDCGPTPTGRLLLSTLNLPVVMVLDAPSNLVDVRDVAEGHVLAAEKGRSGESYLLGHQNMTDRQLVEMTLKMAGIWRPIIHAPAKIASGIGRSQSWLADHLTHRPPLFTAPAVNMTAMGLRANCAKALKELEIPQTPLESSVEDALVWFAEAGLIQNGALSGRLLSELTKR